MIKSTSLNDNWATELQQSLTFYVVKTASKCFNWQSLFYHAECSSTQWSRTLQERWLVECVYYNLYCTFRKQELLIGNVLLERPIDLCSEDEKTQACLCKLFTSNLSQDCKRNNSILKHKVTPMRVKFPMHTLNPEVNFFWKFVENPSSHLRIAGEWIKTILSAIRHFCSLITEKQMNKPPLNCTSKFYFLRSQPFVRFTLHHNLTIKKLQATQKYFWACSFVICVLLEGASRASPSNNAQCCSLWAQKLFWG